MNSGMITSRDRTAVVLGTVGYAASILELVWDFRSQALLMRKGRSVLQEPGEEREASMVDAAEFPGLFIVNCMLGFLIFCVIFMLAFTVVYHPLLWLYVYENLWYIALVVIALAVEFAADCLCEKFVYQEEIAYRYLLIGQIYEVYKFLSTFISGIAVEVGRVLFALGALLFSLIRLNRPMIPQWIYERTPLDSQYKAYVALVGVYEAYNNPIANTFIRLLLEDTRQKTEDHDSGLFRRIVRRRWMRIQGKAGLSPKSKSEDTMAEQHTSGQALISGRAFAKVYPLAEIATIEQKEQ